MTTTTTSSDPSGPPLPPPLPPATPSAAAADFPRDYAGALAALDATQLHGDSLRRAYSARRATMEAMGIYLRRLGIEQAVAKVPTLHVTGSKGKGSTCAFVEAILRRKGLKTVLFTSPHLVRVTERIRVGGRPLAEEAWARHFWAVWDRLHENAPPPDAVGEPEAVPGYFRMLTLVCLWVAVAEQADALILEVGVGGRFDATNVVPAPVACAVATLDLEHTDLLGSTIAAIAWEKGGVMKPGTSCFLAPQTPTVAAEALPVLRECAREAGGAPLRTVKPLAPGTRLGIVGDFQRTNAALAVSLANELLRRRRQRPPPSSSSSSVVSEEDGQEKEVDVGSVLSEDAEVAAALAECSWPGRCQQVDWRDARLYIDGAHTEHSMRVAIEWFDDQTASSPSPKCLVFHCGEEKPVADLLGQLILSAAASSSTPRFAHAVFCPVASARPTLAKARPTRALLLPPPPPPASSLSTSDSGGGDSKDKDEAWGRNLGQYVQRLPRQDRLAALVDAHEEGEKEQQQEGVAEPPSSVAWQRALAGAWRVILAYHLADRANASSSSAADATLDPAAARALLKEADAATATTVAPSVAAALEEVGRLAAEAKGKEGKQLEVLVTGSLYLVGNVLGQLEEEGKGEKK